ncbi:MAG: TonB family protein [Gammaproteobacteria bacterium]
MRFITVLLSLILFISLPGLAQDEPPKELSKELTKTYRAYNKAYAEGDAERAAELAKKVLTVAKRELGPDHSRIPILQINLAHILVLLHRLDEAEPLLLAAGAGLIKHNGKDDLNLTTVYENMAKVYASRKELDKSRKELDKAIAVLTSKHGPEHAGIADLMVQQAALDLAANNIEAAKKMYDKALTIYEQQYGADSLQTAAVFSRQGDVNLLQKDFENAEQKYLAAHRIYVDKLLEDDAIVLASHSRLAKLYIAQRDDRFAGHADTVIKYSPKQDGPAVPLFVLRPKYPIFEDGTRPQGWSLLEFAVNANGRVVKPKVVESWPGKLFDQVSMEVAPEWRFKPKVVEGKRVAQDKTRVRLVFRQENIEVYFGEVKFETGG